MASEGLYYNQPKYDWGKYKTAEGFAAKMPTYKAPEYKPYQGALPSYYQPTYSQKEVGNLAQQQMMPGLAKLRRGLASTGAMYSENPAERDAMLRQLMAGYGQGLGGLQAGATSAAQGLYAQQYGAAEKQAQANYQIGQQQYQKGLADWEAGQTAQAQQAKMGYQTEMQKYQMEQAALDAENKRLEQEAQNRYGYMKAAEERGREQQAASQSELKALHQKAKEYEAGRWARLWGSGSGNTGAGGGSGGGASLPASGGLGLPATGPGERFGPSTVTPITYGAGSEEAYKRAIREGELASGLGGWDMGGGKSGLSLLDSSKGFNPYA